jgi:hypothetical protein
MRAGNQNRAHQQAWLVDESGEFGGNLCAVERELLAASGSILNQG